jgi:hypothetical protein
MGWGRFEGVDVTDLARVDGNINTSTCIAILQSHLLPLQLPQFAITFQQDNAPAHKSRTTMRWLHDNNIQLWIGIRSHLIETLLRIFVPILSNICRTVKSMGNITCGYLFNKYGINI